MLISPIFLIGSGVSVAIVSVVYAVKRFLFNKTR